MFEMAVTSKNPKNFMNKWVSSIGCLNTLYCRYHHVKPTCNTCNLAFLSSFLPAAGFC